MENFSKIELRFPQEYIEFCHKTMTMFGAKASEYCKEAIAQDEPEIVFTMPYIKVIQALTIEKVLEDFGALVEREWIVKNGRRCCRFRVDVSNMGGLDAAE